MYNDAQVEDNPVGQVEDNPVGQSLVQEPAQDMSYAGDQMDNYDNLVPYSDNPGHGHLPVDPVAAAANAAAIAASLTAGAPAGDNPDPGNPLMHHPDGQVSEVLEVPKHLVGKLIGRAGATIQTLQQSTGTSIQIDHASGGDDKKVTVKGTPEAVEKAKESIHQVLETEGPAEGEVNKMIPCPPGIVGRIIGRGGETIRSLQQASGAHIMVDQNFPEGVDRQIQVSGKPDSVDRAEKMVIELINGEPGSAQSVVQKVGMTTSQARMPLQVLQLGLVIQNMSWQLC